MLDLPKPNDHSLPRGWRLEKFLDQDSITYHTLVQFVGPVIEAVNIDLQVLELAARSHR